MTSPKGALNTDKSERQRLSAALTPRQRRSWFAKLLEEQEAVEAREDSLSQTILDAYNAGMSYEQIAGAIGSHSTTIRDRLLKWVGDERARA